MALKKIEARLVHEASAYGYCPYCSAAGTTRERRPNGNDGCENGHTYPSNTAVPDADKLEAAYKGTKSKDLLVYLKGICPELRFQRGDGPGAKDKDPSRYIARISIVDAHKLGSKLLKDKWEGHKGKRTNKDTKEVSEYVMYTPLDDTNAGQVQLFKPSKGATDTRIWIRQRTAASMKAEQEMHRLKRQMDRTMQPRRVPEDDAFGYGRGGGGGGYGYSGGPRGRTGGGGGGGGYGRY